MQVRYIGLLWIFLLPFHMAGQSFSNFLVYLNTLPDTERQTRVDSFLAVHPVCPLIESDSICHFIYTGNVQNVQIAGDFSNWSSLLDFSRVEGTNLWYLTQTYEPDARLDYKLIIDGNQWILDPRNSYTCTGGFGPNSELRMPQYVPPVEVEYNSGIAHGSIRDTTFYSIYLKNSRKIWVYTPAGMSPEKSYPVAYVHDGDGYLALASMRNVLDNLIAWGQLQPLIAVFIPPVDRTEEYAGSKQAAFTDFMVKEVVPWIDKRYPTILHPWGRANLGASNGGNISLWLTVSHPEVFGLVAAMSSNVENNIKTKVQQGVTPSVKYYLDIGTYDIPILIQRVADFRQLLENGNEVFLFQQFHEGHSWGNWKAHIDDALIWLFGAVGSTGENPKTKIRCIYQPDTNNILITLPSAPSNDLKCSVFDLSGKLCSEVMAPAGTNDINWKAPDLSPGIYLVVVKGPGFVASEKVKVH